MSSKERNDKNKFSFFKTEKDDTDKNAKEMSDNQTEDVMECEPSASHDTGLKKGKQKLHKKSHGESPKVSSMSSGGHLSRGRPSKWNQNPEEHKPIFGLPESYVRQKSKDRSYNKSLDQIGSSFVGLPSSSNEGKTSHPKGKSKRQNAWIPFHRSKSQGGTSSERCDHLVNYPDRRVKDDSDMPLTPIEKFLPSRKRQKVVIDTRNKEETGASASQSKPSPPSVRHIPGFYYDPEKKRYFKILPGHSNSSSSCITDETMKNIEAENTRQRLFSEKQESKVVSKYKKSSLNLRLSHQTGTIHPQQYVRESIDCRIRSLDVEPVNTIDLSAVLDYHVSGISNSDNIRYLELDRSQTKVLMVVSNDAISRIHLGTVSSKKNEFKQLEFKEWSPVTVIDTRKSAINTACLVNVDQQDISYPGSLYVLFTLSGEGNNMVRLIKCPSDEEDVSYISYSMESKREIYHSCAWSNNPFLPAHLSVGLHLQAEVVDILSSNRIKLDTNQNEVYSQVFAKRSTVLYNGIKNGEILTFDLRASPRSWREHLRPLQYSPQLNHTGAVCSLKLLKDEDYLLAADFSGAIKLWDLRTRRVVQDIEGHHNEYKVLPVNLDHTESIICAVGQDKHTRLWNMKTGNHLRTIPSPFPVSETSIPAAAFSLDWGRRTFSGVLVGAQRKLFWYPL